MGITAGIDVGARATKVALLDDDGRLRGSSVVRTRPPFDTLVDGALDQALAGAGMMRADVSYVATTGFGRSSYAGRDAQITDVTAAAYGASRLVPGVRCVMDVGSQSTRAMRILPSGRVSEFKSNDKCAAGAGGFVERAARYLEVDLAEVGALSMRGAAPVSISSVCAVLAESEIINHVSQGRTVEDILRGIHNSLAERAVALLKRVGIEPEIALVGGMAHQQGMIEALTAALGMAVRVPEQPELVNAIGAALLSRRRREKVVA